ncbi:hypothetical protein [Dulcicalothrix desertica]|uniref:hypothetical protein n=1 Tax=Dulcicalothrix desertica TaxID=32056 RepID=UPI0016497308|nr:hypothetical protein [Dulcicalothrix desertica]
MRFARRDVINHVSTGHIFLRFYLGTLAAGGMGVAMRRLKPLQAKKYQHKYNLERLQK